MKPASIDVPVSFTGQVTLQASAGVLPILIDGIDVTNRLWQLAGAFDDSTLNVKIKSINTAWGKTNAIVLTVHHPYLASIDSWSMRRIAKVIGNEDK